MPRSLVAALAAAGLALACGSAEPVSPQQVALDFWDALKAGDVAAAEALATPGSARRVETLHQGRAIDEVLLGETLAGEASAIVRTSLATTVDRKPLHTTFDTHLVRRGDEWRVDAVATERSFTAAIFASTVDLLGEAVGRGVEEFSAVLEEGAAEISRAIREALQELERDLQQEPRPDPL